jgi:hypothetical protein
MSTPRKPTSIERRAGVFYMSKIPLAIPARQVLVHNYVTPPTRRLGTRGFRAWLASASAADLELCPCGWAPELPRHYRIVVTAWAPRTSPIHAMDGTDLEDLIAERTRHLLESARLLTTPTPMEISMIMARARAEVAAAVAYIEAAYAAEMARRD